MNNKLYITSVSGIRIYIHWTFFLLIAWLVFSKLSNGLGITALLWSLTYVMTIFACVTLHELGHALAAKKFKIKTRDITLLPIGGVAQMESIPEKPREELIVAMAGPMVNVIISLLLFLILPWDKEAFLQIQSIDGNNFLYALLVVNLWLALFNLIPAFPMDGGRVFRAILAYRMPRIKATRIAVYLGQIISLGFVVLGILNSPVLVLIGIFIFLGAQSEMHQTEMQYLLHGNTVQDVLIENVPQIESDSSIRYAADQLLHSQNKYFLVKKEAKVLGTLGRDEITKALQELGEKANVCDAMRPELLYLSPEMPVENAWKMMQHQKQNFALVGTQSCVLGALDIDNIIELMMLKSAGKGQK